MQNTVGINLSKTNIDMMTKIAMNRQIMRVILSISMLLSCLLSMDAQAQFFDPNNSLILGTLRQISVKHNIGLQEQRLQTAQLVQQVKQFYDTYTLVQQDVEFTQSLYQDLKAVDQLDLTNSYAVSNFIINGDQLNFWLPRTTSEVTQTTMDAENILGNAKELQRVYDSFALSVDSDEIPKDLVAKRHNALMGQEVFSRALIEHAIKSQILAKTYDSLAVELNKQIRNPKNKYTQAERTQLAVEAVKLRELSNSYYEKYLKISQEAHTNELNMFDDKLSFLSKRFNWKILQSHVNKTSKIRYGFFDISRARIE